MHYDKNREMILLCGQDRVLWACIVSLDYDYILNEVQGTGRQERESEV
jgi:hypothetical protein